MAPTSQASDAIAIYTPRAEKYDTSFHPALASAFTTFVDVQPGSRLLDLACGTGLVARAFAPVLGRDGHITGIDVTPAMLDVAKQKGATAPEDARQQDDSVAPKGLASCEWLLGDVKALPTVRSDSGESLQPSSYDLITCCSALALFQEPTAVVRGWKDYLKPGGRVMVDFPREKSQIVGVVMEEVLREMGKPVPYYRTWVKREESLAEVLQDAGLVVEKCFTTGGFGNSNMLRVGELDEVWKKWMVSVPQLEGSMGEDATRLKTRWETRLREMANSDGVIEQDDGVYIAVARKE